MANETKNNSNHVNEILNEGKSIPILTPITNYEEKGLTIPILNIETSQITQTESNTPKTTDN